jgi:NitT/TauT family transport system substrate-binding protein
MSRSDDIMLAIKQGLPLLIVAAQMQHDPQAIMVHASSPVQSFKDLDGRTLMGSPGANWVAYLQRHYGITFNIVPLDYGIARFMSDKNFIQQCFISNEPYHAELNGAPTRALLISSGGYDPYRVLYTSLAFARAHPEAVRAFVAASIRGWQEFLYADATEARAAIAKENPSQTPPLMDYSIAAMKRYQLVDGDSTKGERLGLLTPERMRAQMAALVELGLLAEPMPLAQVVSFEFLPADLRPSTTPSS